MATVAATALVAGCSAAAATHTTHTTTKTHTTTTTHPTTTTSTAPTVTQASVTGYKTGDPAFASAGPITVVLHGKTAAHLDQILNSLPKGANMNCAENVLLYNITFTLTASPKTIAVAGWACVAAVQVTENGKMTLRTDKGCTLLEAVRKVLPARAVTTQQAGAACDD
jgi:hypothetical protein